MKKTLALILALCMLLALCACTQEAPAETPAEPEKADTEAVVNEQPTEQEGTDIPAVKIGYLCQTKDYEFHKNALEGTIKAADEAGIEMLYQVVGTDAAEIRKTFDSFLAQGCNVIVDFSCSSEPSQQVAKLCEQNGIYDICVDTDCTEYGSTTYFFGLNNSDAGKLMGEEAYNWCVEQGIADKVDHVIQVNASALGDAVWSRTNDAVKTFLEKSGLSEDAVENIDITNYDLADIRQKVQDYLPLCADYEQIVIFSLSSSWTPAIVAAVDASGLDTINYFSVDGVSETINTFRAAKNGEDTILKGEVATSPELYGVRLIEIAQQLVAGETLEKYNYSINHWMTKDNVDELYPE